MQSAGTPSASALGHGMEVRPVHGSSEIERGRGLGPRLSGFGIWRRLVARLTGGEEVVGSNPAIPTGHQVAPGAGWPTQNETVGACGARETYPTPGKDKEPPRTSPSWVRRQAACEQLSWGEGVSRLQGPVFPCGLIGKPPPC